MQELYGQVWRKLETMEKCTTIFVTAVIFLQFRDSSSPLKFQGSTSKAEFLVLLLYVLL